MPDHTPIVPRSLVNRYIEGAQLVARSKTERLTVDMALRLNALTPTFRAEREAKGKFIAEMHFAAKESQAEKYAAFAIWLPMKSTRLCVLGGAGIRRKLLP